MSIAARMLEAAQIMSNNKRYAELYTYCRYTYRIGRPVVDDAYYDRLHQVMMSNYGKHEALDAYLDRTYDDDPIPVNLLKEFGLEGIIPVDVSASNEYYQYLNEDKSMSIKPLVDADSVWEYFKAVRGERLVMSLKIDGINSKSLLMPFTEGHSELKLSLSRGRAGNSWDMTPRIQRVLPRTFAGLGNEVKVFAECFMQPEKLDYLSEKYHKDQYKTAKSSAISFLRRDHETLDYRYLRVLAFSAEGLADTLSATLAKLSVLGFEVVPHIVLEADEVPADYNEFRVWLDNKLAHMVMLEKQHGTTSDGVVVDVDNFTYNSADSGQYNSRNCAIKLGYWSFQYYAAVIDKIVVEQQMVEGSTRLQLHPVMAKDRTKATFLPGFNPDIVISNDLGPGDIVFFERNSGAINSMLYGKKLAALQQTGALPSADSIRRLRDYVD